MLREKPSGIDFILPACFGYFFSIGGIANECGMEHFFSSHRFPAWIKQDVRIKAFHGTSENAVKTQIWIAVSVYVLVAIVKKRLGVKQSLYTILQILSVTLFEKTPILQAFSEDIYKTKTGGSCNQLLLWDL